MVQLLSALAGGRQCKIDPAFKRDLDALPREIQCKTAKAVRMLAEYPDAGGLNVKKVRAARGHPVWEARVDQAYRLLWQWAEGFIYLWRVGPHDVIDEARKLGDPDLMRALAPAAPMPATDGGPTLLPCTPAPVVARRTALARFPTTVLRLLGVPEDRVEDVRAVDDPEAIWDLALDADVQLTLYDVLSRPGLDLGDALFDPARLLYRATADSLEGYCAGRIKRLLLELEPEQRRYVDLRTRGPFLLRGVAGSGKTTIGIYRAKTRADAGGRVLYLTYNKSLVGAVKELFEELYGGLPSGIEVSTVDSWLLSFLHRRGYALRVDSRRTDHALAGAIADVRGRRREPVLRRPQTFFRTEIDHVIKGRGLASPAEYQDVDRAGTGSGLGSAARAAVWEVYEAYGRRLEREGLADFGDVRLLALRELESGPPGPYDEVIVDEAQDLVPVQLRAVRRLAAGESIFLLADAAQSIYYRGVSWRDAGMEIVGRARILRTNHRNTAEVLRAAASLVVHSPTLRSSGEYTPPEPARRRGPRPVLVACASDATQAPFIRGEVLRLCGDGRQRFRPGDIAVLAPYREWCRQVRDDLLRAGIPCRMYERDEPFAILENEVKVITIHSAKGLEFPVVFVVGLVEGNSAYQRFPRKIDTAATPHEQVVALDQERRLLYVGMTRAAERLYLITTRGQLCRFLNEIEPDAVVWRDEPA
jgi:superfamily I DNA/RNA helicase/mRNA-degrading endonuclease RelE of RelBE toxin-antitoxin system